MTEVKIKYDPQLDIIQSIKDSSTKKKDLNKSIPIEVIELDNNLLFVNDLPITYPFEKDQLKCKTTELPKLPDQKWDRDLSTYLATMKRDRTGTYYRSLSNLIHNDEKAHEVLFTFLDRYSRKGGPERKSYIRLNSNKEIEVFSYTAVSYTSISIIKTYYLVLSRSNSSYRTQDIRISPKDFQSVIDKINIKLFGITDMDSISKLRPSQDNDKWGVFDSAFGFNQVPQYKSICFETLKQEFLINKENGLKQIKSLTFDLLHEFIDNCCKDERPIGFEIVNTLYNDKEERLKEEKVFNSLYPLDKIIGSWLNRDTWYRYNYEYKFKVEPYSENILINVYDNYDQFVFKKLPQNVESRILIKSNSKITTGTAASSSSSSSSNIGKPSIVNKETFLNNFHSATKNLFKDNGIGKDVLFIGGIVTHCLTGQQEGFESSDIDICILHHEDFLKAKNIITKLFGEDFEEKGMSLNVLGGHAVFSLFYPDRPVQINLYTFKDIQDILLGVDIDCSCFAFDGENVFTLERGMASLNYRFNIASEFSYQVRGDNQYQRRLLKYLDRGFDIFYHSTPLIEQIIANFDKENGTSIYQSGFELLLSAKYNQEIHKSLLETNKQRALPYGPGWKKENFDKYMQDCFDIVFDGYSSSGVYCPCEDIDSIFSYRETERELLNDQLSWDLTRFPEEYKYIKDEEEDRESLYDDLPALEEYLNLDSNGDVNQKSSKSLKLNQDDSNASGSEEDDSDE